MGRMHTKRDTTVSPYVSYVRGDAKISPWRGVSMVVRDLPRQPEMRKGLLKAIHRANG